MQQGRESLRTVQRGRYSQERKCWNHQQDIELKKNGFIENLYIGQSLLVPRHGAPRLQELLSMWEIREFLEKSNVLRRKTFMFCHWGGGGERKSPAIVVPSQLKAYLLIGKLFSSLFLNINGRRLPHI